MMWIILFHYTTRYGELFEYDTTFGFENGGRVGVAMFFVISGYFLAHRLLDENYSGWRNVLAFDVNRYWRLYPSYLITIIFIYLAVDVCLSLPSREASIQTFLINCVLIWHPHIGYVDGAHWFIADLVKIQLLLGFLFFIPKKRTPILMIVTIVLLTVASIKCFVYEQLFGQRLLEVLCGITIYKAIEEKDVKYCVLALLMMAYQIIVVHFILMTIYLAMFVLLLIPNAVNSFVSKIHILNNRAMVYLGAMSFSWYLVHQNIGYIIIGHLCTKSYWGG